MPPLNKSRRTLVVAALIGAFLAPTATLAAGDVAKGEADFKKCKACHSITKPDGTAVVKGGKTGPDLFGVIGRPAAATTYGYGDAIKAAAAAGLVWDEASLVAYLADPSAFLQQKLGDPAAKSKMPFKLGKGGEDIAAYLATLK